MRGLASLVTALFLAGCAVSSEMVQHGSKKILLTQTQNQWAENVVLVSDCGTELVNGTCPPDAPIQAFIVSGKLPGVISGVGHDVTAVTSALIVRDGLKGSKAVQKNQTDVRASTVNPK